MPPPIVMMMQRTKQSTSTAVLRKLAQIWFVVVSLLTTSIVVVSTSAPNRQSFASCKAWKQPMCPHDSVSLPHSSSFAQISETTIYVHPHFHLLCLFGNPTYDPPTRKDCLRATFWKICLSTICSCLSCCCVTQKCRVWMVPLSAKIHWTVVSLQERTRKYRRNRIAFAFLLHCAVEMFLVALADAERAPSDYQTK